MPLPLLGDPLPLPLPCAPEAPLSGDDEPLGEEPLDGEPLDGALGPDVRHSHAAESVGAKFTDSKHGETNSGYGRVDGAKDSTHVQVPLSAGELSFEFDCRALNFWQRA